MEDRRSRRISDALQRALRRFLMFRKSRTDRLTRDQRVSQKSSAYTSTASATPVDSAPPTSVSVVEDCSDCGEVVAQEQIRSTSRLDELTHDSSSDRLARCDETPSSPMEDRPAVCGILDAGVGADSSSTKPFPWSSPRRGPPTPPISPTGTSPAPAWERGKLTLSEAREGVPIMASQVQRTRDEFKTGIAVYFKFVFADAKILQKMLRKLASALCGLGEELEIVSRSMLDQIELLDMHLGTLLQEGDRIIRAMTRGSARTGPLAGKSRSMRKDLIKHDLAPQMLEFAENIGQIETRVRAMTQTIAAERAGENDSA